MTTTNNGGGKRRLKDSSLRACNKSAFNKKYLGVHKSIAYHILEFTPGSVIFKSYIINIFNFNCLNFFLICDRSRTVAAGLAGERQTDFFHA